MQDELRSAALEAERRVTALEALLAQRDADITQLKQVTSRGSTVLRLNIFWGVGVCQVFIIVNMLVTDPEGLSFSLK